MAFFRFGEREDPNRVERVAISDTLNLYRYGNWDPIALLDDVRLTSLEASTEGRHLWNSDERLQMMAASAWLGAARQLIANSLLMRTEKDDRVPQDVAKIAEDHYEAALIWHEERDRMSISKEFELTTDLDIHYTWPNPHQQPVSQELFTALKSVVEDFFSTYLPRLQTHIENPFQPPIFNAYSKQLEKTRQALIVELQSINRLWGPQLSPNTSPGKQAYVELITIIESIIELGAHTTIPVARDRTYKLAKREEERDTTNTFNPAGIAAPIIPRVIHLPDSPGFDAAALAPPPQPVEKTNPEPQGEPFTGIAQIAKEQADRHPAQAFTGIIIPQQKEDKVEPHGEAFNPLSQTFLPEQQAFDPATLAEPREDEPQAFDPRKFL